MSYPDEVLSGEPIDAQFEPAPDVDGEGSGRAKPARLLIIAVAVAAALIGGLSGSGAAIFLGSGEQGGGEQASVAAADRIQVEAALERTGDTLSELDRRMGRISERLDALEAAQFPGAGLERLAERIEALEEQMGEDRQGPDPAFSRESLSGIEARITVLEQANVALRESPSPSEIALTRQAQAALALSAIEAAARRGDGFEADYTVLRLSGNAQGPISRLAPFTAGVATLAELQADFPAIQEDILNSTRKAGDKPASAGLGWIASALGDAVSIRPANQSADPLTELTSQASQALVTGNLAGAVSVLGALDGEAQEAARIWVEEANRRLELEAVLEDIRDSLTELED